jgi:hypothetical protein
VGPKNASRIMLGGCCPVKLQIVAGRGPGRTKVQPWPSQPIPNECEGLVAVEKLPFRPKPPNWRDRKCLGKLRTSFVGLPNAKFFRHFLVIECFNTHAC